MLGVIKGLSELFQDKPQAKVATRTVPKTPQETPEMDPRIIALNQQVAYLEVRNKNLYRLFENTL
jgi:hypothetical protein